MVCKLLTYIIYILTYNLPMNSQMVLRSVYPYQLAIGKAIHVMTGILFRTVFPRSFKVVSEWLISYSCLFLQGVSIALLCKPCTSYTIGMSVCLSVCPSVRPSVTRWHCVKTTQAIGSRNLHRRIADGTLVFGIKNSSRNSKGFTPSEGIKWEGVGKIRNFQPITRRISETVQDRTKVTINHQ